MGLKPVAGAMLDGERHCEGCKVCEGDRKGRPYISYTGGGSLNGGGVLPRRLAASAFKRSTASMGT